MPPYPLGFRLLRSALRGQSVPARDARLGRRAPLLRRAHAPPRGAHGLDQPVLFEAAQGVAHDVAADAELFGERALRRDRVAGAELAGEDSAGDLVEDLLGLRLVRPGPDAYV